jgi:Second Messenger Oligonucleotide or Dinucleotide Synthetase domain
MEINMNIKSDVPLIKTNKRNILVGLLDQLCQQIEISESQYKTATERYEAVGLWLSESDSLRQAQIYPHGSIALGTAKKPISQSEFDVDLMCFNPNISVSTDPHVVKALIGSRLREHETYRDMLEEKQRCWRINYANEFHLDITPSILNPHCFNRGELVPDKKLAQWKPTNPKGYISRFEQYAAINPRIQFSYTALEAIRAEVEPLPEQSMTKPFLKRIVQLLKHHRDYNFVGTDQADLAPISIIITTLAGWAYAKCATTRIYTDAFDFITDVIREMPTFIRIENNIDIQYFIVENETTTGENFAEKWNSDNRLALAFFKWHKSVLNDIESLLTLDGVDQIADSLANNFGAKKQQVRDLFASIYTPINKVRSDGSLLITPTLGLTSSPSYGSVYVPQNTFFGR